MTSTDLTAAILLGVLLPASFARPRFLQDHPMRDHVRRRWNFLYTCAAFATIGYVYASGVCLLRPVHSLSQSDRRVLAGGGLILLLIACGHHVPPLLVGTRRRRATLLRALLALPLGLLIGGFLAVDEVFADVHHPLIAMCSCILVFALTIVGTVCHSGISPQLRIALYVRRRRRRNRVARSTSPRRREEPGERQLPNVSRTWPELSRSDPRTTSRRT